MDTSIIDLCDSEDDDTHNHTAATTNQQSKIQPSKKPPKIYNSPSSSSSSSSDEELWNAGGFLNNKPKKEEVVRKGNYFKEVKEKCAYGANSTASVANTKSGVALKSSLAVQKASIRLEEDDDEEFDEDVRNSPLKKKSDKSKSGTSNGNKVPVKAVGDVECIEIDLSSSDDDDVNNKPTTKKRNNGSNSNSNQAKIGHDESPFRIRKRSSVSVAKKMTAVEVASKPPPPKKTKAYNNSYNNSDDNNVDDDDSSTTVPLPESKSFPTTSKTATNKRQQTVHEEIDLSMDMSDDDGIDFNNNDDPFNDNDNAITNDFGGNVDDVYSSSSSSDDGDKKPSHKKVQMAAAAAKSRDVPIDIDSDDSSSSSSSTDLLDLYTPRPMKKKKGNAKMRKTSFTTGTNLNNATTTNKAYSSDKKKCPDSIKSTTSTSSKLLTPREFSPSTTSPFGATFAAATAVKLRVPTPAIPAMSAKVINEIGGKLYPDLTHNFIIALTSQARRARHNSYQRASFDSALRSIVVIALHMRPLRSAEATRRMKGVGSNFYDLLKESVAGSKSKKPFEPKKGKFTCVAAAALVGLLEMEERVQRDAARVASANGNDDATLSFPMEDLIVSINSLLDSRANANLSQTAQQYLNKDNLDPGWGQVKKLCSTNAASDLGGPFMKERKRKGACSSGRVFELLDSGRSLATKLRTLAQSGPFEPGPLRQLPDESVDQEFGNVTMSMDFREGGGGGRSLHKMCDQLDIRGVPYVVRELKIADYIFFVGEKLAPVLIERKTADDVAGSLHDGRWERQQRSMRKAQYVLGGGSARRCQICYIIEGDASKRTVHGGNVGRRTWFQSVDDVENAIEKLPSLGFSVMRSKSTLDTIGILAKVAQDVSWKVNNGNIDVMYSYEQFLSRVKKLGEDKGEPPTDRAHQNPAPPVVVNTNFMSSTANAATAAASSTRDDDATFSPQRSDSPGGFGSDDDAPQQTNNAEKVAELKKLSMARLKEMLKERDEKTGGKKEELISRLLKPRKPELLILRARRKEYVPKVPSSNAAIMVALLLNHIPGTQGLTKERLMVLAEETGVSKESMSGDGSSFYDGWSGMKQLQEGDPALVRREKGHRYSLTTQPPESAGVAVANALHILAHREDMCTCGNPPNGV
eukprot:scaffold7820_cov99-Skeletonema_marinoi.AAC.1